VTWQWVSERTGQLPLVLAGPILRRVEPGLVCVWVAMQQAQSIALTVQAAGAPVATNVTAALPNGQSAIQLGDNLFVALLTAQPPASAPLQPGVLYSYELTFTSPEGTSTSFASAMSAPGATPGLSGIVYTDPGSQVTLPSFSLPPQTLSQVRLAHASCRKAGGQGLDALPLLDKVIADARTGAADAQFALGRPHQLFLTGDQIYADDVTDSYLGMCIDAAGWLMGTRQEPAPALLGILGPPDSNGNHPFPAQASGWPVLENRPLGSTPWDAATWPGVGVRGKLVFAAGLTAVSPDTDKLDPLPQVLPTGWREVSKYYLTRNHLIALGEFYAALLLAWSPVLWCPPGATGDPLPLPYDGSNVLANWDEDAPTLERFGTGVAAVRRVLANVPTYMICDDHDVTDDWFMNRLWCRRVLDLPGDALGRRIVRNALIAYAIFQAWGNTPDQFDLTVSSSLGGQLLTQLAAGKEMTDDLASPSAAGGVSALVGVPQPLAASAPALVRPGNSLTWHYRWGPTGWPYEVIVLDCRTLRRYGAGLVQPPQLLDDGTATSANPDQFAAQLGTPVTGGATVTLVVAQTPVLGVRWVEDLFQRSTRTKNVFDHDAEAWSLSPNGYELMLARLAAHNPAGVILLSGDVHYSFAASADYCASTPWGQASPLATALTGRIVQLNSSAARNETGLTRDFLHITGYSLLSMPDVETWGGFRVPPAYAAAALQHYAAEGSDAVSLAAKLNQPPVVLTQEEYQALYAGSASAPTPDWKYRIQFAPGTRDSGQPFSPPPSLASLPPSLLDQLSAAGQSLGSLVRRYSAIGGTQIVGKNNVCLVTFTGQDASSWHVQQAVMWRPDWDSVTFPVPNPLQATPVSMTTPADVTRYDIPLQYGTEPQMSAAT